MYRPGGFPEFNPQDQKKFDAVLQTITTIFEQHQFDHIWTPAIEPVEIIKRGGDIVDKQVYGLFGLAQGVEDVKDFALHFDLTIPLARYILDHRNDITFPFKRYQMQPVWRGERTKRGRYKEFRQFDVDVVRQSSNNVGTRYDIETVYVLDRSMQAVIDNFGLNIKRVCKIAHVGLTKQRLESLNINGEIQIQVLGLLDNYFKFQRQDFEQKLESIITITQAQQIYHLIDNKNYHTLNHLSLYKDLDSICQGLSNLGVNYEFDVCIVRGHAYYKGMVCEWFEPNDIELGSLAGGGRYDNVTDFIDPKQSFSGVGTSLGRFVYLAVDQIKVSTTKDSYLVLHFEDTVPQCQQLYQQLIKEGKLCSFYPTGAKLSKQFEYADKKGYRYAVMMGGNELKQKIYQIKDLNSGEIAAHNL